MGYRLAGFDVIGMNEIDPRMARCYRANLGSGLHYVEDIRQFRKRGDLPAELFKLDILDGSPPCSSFSMAGNRMKNWGKTKKFAEGQKKQTLDDLFFEFIALAGRLKPRFVLSENVEGLVKGEAKKYVARIHADFERVGYHVGRYLVDMSDMGLPQRRRRVFFIGARNDLLPFLPEQVDLFNRVPFLDLLFKKSRIDFSVIRESINSNRQCRNIPKKEIELMKYYCPGDRSLQAADERAKKKKPGTGNYFTRCFTYDNEPVPTLTGSCSNEIMVFEGESVRRLSQKEIILASSFPLDYDFGDKLRSGYVMGMSVPPMAIRKIAERMAAQWLERAEGR